jgi:prolyl-tRNA synthetase
MKDAYSFDIDKDHAVKSYYLMYETYRKIFTKCGLEFRAVEAGTGAIGGTLSHEFQVLASNGEDAILSCSECGYAANIEKAECLKPQNNSSGNKAEEDITEVNTPEKRTIEEITDFLNVPADKLCKTLVYLADGNPVVVLIRGDHELAETKLTAVLKCDALLLADDNIVQEVTGAPTGFAGPVGLKKEIPVYADNFLKNLEKGVTGANKKDTHLLNIYADRDFPDNTVFEDLRTAKENETCPRCKKGKYEMHRGIEVGQVFYLGKKYSEKMNAYVLDENGKSIMLTMGCYGIGVTRTMASAIEQNYDDNGIIWPFPIAPFHVIICPVGKDHEIKDASENLYNELLKDNVEVIFDDRGERPGVMFKDADLLGIPLRITMGSRTIKKGKCEIKLRRERESNLIEINKAKNIIKDIIKKEIE